MSLLQEGEFEYKDGVQVIKAPWAEEAFQEFLRSTRIADETDLNEMRGLRETFAAGWYSSNKARKTHGRE